MNRFLELLEAGPSNTRCVFNPWADHDERDRPPRKAAPQRRRENMAAYLDARRRSARVVLLGEAPSHRGCRFSGIAFCSEVELVHKPALVARKPLALTSAEADEKPMRERSAAVIWDELARAGCAHRVVLWNAFPWHPYRAPDKAGEATVGPCGPSSNRKPRNPEVEEGRPVLEALLGLFPHPLQVFAVGKVAEQALERWEEIPCAGYIRHPAQGGESRFRAQFREQVVARLGP
jgi:uracil-DNA glycosylase